MTEIKKALEILKIRWKEVIFITGLSILPLILGRLNLPHRMVSLICFMVSLILIALITSLLITGFQRTVYLEGQKQQSLMTLLREGKHFFWRMVNLTIIYFPVYFILVWLTFLIIKRFASIESGFWETAKTHPFAYQLCFTAPVLILIKPLLFMFPLIVVLDCRLFAGFRLLRKCKLLDASELVAVFIVSMAVSSLWIFTPNIKSAATFWGFFLVFGRSILQEFLGLMIMVMSVRFVASLGLVYNGPVASSDVGDLCKYSNGTLRE